MLYKNFQLCLDNFYFLLSDKLEHIRYIHCTFYYFIEYIIYMYIV